jgi:hypothetical protein
MDLRLSVLGCPRQTTNLSFMLNSLPLKY